MRSRRRTEQYVGAQRGGEQRRTLVPRRRRRMKENADAKVGGGQRWTLTSRRRAEEDAGVEEEDAGRMTLASNEDAR